VSERAELLTRESKQDATVSEVADALRSADRFLLTTHENPDGDALGSLLAMHHILTSLGKDSVMFLASKEFPLPVEYRFLPLEEVFHEAPVDLVDRELVFLDCGNIDRMPVDWLQRDGGTLVNIDHHHDNTRFGTLNLVDVEASSTAEIVFALARELGAELTPDIAQALYVGLVTDTGRFMYENTTARSHEIAAELIKAGVDVDDTYRRLYEKVPLEKLRLVQRALASVETHADGVLVTSYVTRDDYTASGASEVHTEGIIDYLRSVAGARVAAMVRDKEDSPGQRKVSLRSIDGDVDVSAIAREKGGGGHARAAGFSTDLDYDELIDFLSAALRAQL
jgi:bifunctional oligoribonuclease and PAP phosphatase NrnA